MPENGDDYFTPRQVADLFKVSLSTVERWLRLGLVEGIRLPGGQYRIPASEVERLKKTPPK
jgi:excisionase family DNA binding protein